MRRYRHWSATRLTTTKQYDYLNRLQLITSVPSASGQLPLAYGYQYNDANQRTRVTLGDGGYWIYTYDKLGQVISGNKYWQDGSPVDGQQFNYALDDIGNRTATGGCASAASTYTRNRLSQYSQRTVAGFVDVLGVANPTAGVTVNGSTANRKGDYFHWPLTVNNASAAQYPTITVVSQYGATQNDSGEVFVPAATESYTHDLDGNLTADGRWNYTWDTENRLIEMKRDTSSPTLTSRLRLTFEYDHQGRRIRKTYFTHNGSIWVEQTDTVFLYDGWTLMGELDANNSDAKVRTYVWGLDLSGQQAPLLGGAGGGLQGAGGVGGLLKVTDYTSGTTHHFVSYDGNGNVAALIDGSTGVPTARYEYGPFGEATRATGTLAKKNPLRFSTKFTDDQNGFLYYGYRYYTPSTGRWLSRDRIEETGGKNLYGFLANDSIERLDPLGLQWWWPLVTSCMSCKCKVVSVQPSNQVEAHVVPRPGAPQPGQPSQDLHLGVRTPYKIEVEGNPALCKCSYTDGGTLKYKVQLNVPGFPSPPAEGTETYGRPSDTHPTDGGCVSGTDWPGFHAALGPLGGSGTYSLTYDMTVTLRCTGSDGKPIEDSKPLRGSSEGSFTWPPQK